MRRSVIALMEHLGDIIAAEPIARHLKARGDQVTWVTTPRYHQVVRDNSNIDDVIIVPDLSAWAAMPYERMFDDVYDLHFDQRLSEPSKIPVAKRTGDKTVSLENYYDNGRSLLAAFCRSAGLPELDLPPVVHGRQAPRPTPEPYVLFHCKSNEVMRDWNPISWKMLAVDVASLKIPVLEIGETPELQSVRGARGLPGHLSFPELVSAVWHASLFVGCVSGPSHIADALGVNSVIVSGSYRSWRHFNPYSGSLRKDYDSSVISLGIPSREVPYPYVRLAVMNKLHQIIEKEKLK